MRASRREVLVGALALGACGRELGRTGDVLAAGPPAAILVLALAPDRLMGWPRRPSPDALALLADGGTLPELGSLTGVGRSADLEALAARSPALAIDYGDTAPRFREIAARTGERLGIPYRLIDGRLAAIPDAFERAGETLGAAARGRELAGVARDVLGRWSAARGGPSFYYARGRDGLETGFAGSLATEVLEGGSWRNVAPAGQGVERIGRERLAAWDPEVVVTLDRGFALSAADDPLWRGRRDGSRRRLLVLPDLPFGWIDRPPSINRLLGCAWMTDPTGRSTSELARRLWRLRGPGSDLPVAPRWIA